MARNWHEVGSGFRRARRNQLFPRRTSPGVKTSRMYKLWLESNPQATRRELIEVLEDMELNRQADEYKKYLQQIIKKTTLRPEPTLPEPNPTESIILSHPRIIVAIIFLAILAFIIISIILCVHLPPPESRAPLPESCTPIPGVIELYGSELREKYNETLTKYKDPKYNEYPTAGPVSVHVPFISLISIVVKDYTKRTAELLHSTTPNEIVRNENIMKIQIKDILKPVSKEQLKFVLIEGEPGIGKSTLAKELALRWANRSDALLNNYDIVFLIQLRFESYHKVNASIEDLFVDLDNQSINMTDLHVEIKKRKGAGILWILDGFDELPNHLKSDSFVLMKLIKGEILPKSTVIVTSRPVASYQLLYFVHEHDSKRISLRGFDSNKTIEYASKYFKNEEILSKFHSYYSGNLVIESMLYNPLHCFIVCTIFNDLIATSNEQYPKTMTSLYNHYVRILLKRYLNKTGLITDPDHYDMPQHLMLETDFNDPLLQSVWKNFLLLSEIAFNGTIKQQYIFGNELHNVTKLSMMDTIVNFFVFQKDESSSFLHTTLQEYFAAVYLVNNKPIIKKNKLKANFEVVLTFYVGICNMTGRDLDFTILNILKPYISQYNDIFNYTKEVDIGRVLLRCLYEDDSLIYNIGLPSNYSLYLPSTSANFDSYICGYLVAVHNMTYKIYFNISDQINAFNKGLQSRPSIEGKINLRVSIGFYADDSRQLLNKLLLMPIRPVIKIKIKIFLSNEFNLKICQIISRFHLLEDIQVSAAILSTCRSLKENPLLNLQELNRLSTSIGYPLHENELETLKQLIAPGRPLKLLNVFLTTNGSLASHYAFMKILNIIKMETSLEEMTIHENIIINPNRWNRWTSTHSYIRWTRSTKSLTVLNNETFYYYIQIKNEISTLQLSSFTALYTHIKTNSYMLDNWIPATVTVYSESTTFNLNHFIDAFGECIILLKKLLVKTMHETINIKLNINFTCTCAIVEQDADFYYFKQNADFYYFKQDADFSYYFL